MREQSCTNDSANGTTNATNDTAARRQLLRLLTANSSTVVLNSSSSDGNVTDVNDTNATDVNGTNMSSSSSISSSSSSLSAAVSQTLGTTFNNQSIILQSEALNRSLCEVLYLPPIVPFQAPNVVEITETIEERQVFLKSPSIDYVHPRYGFDVGGNMISVFGQNLPALLLDSKRQPAVRCDFGKAGVTFATFSNASMVRCPNPPYFQSDTVSLSPLVDNTAY